MDTDTGYRFQRQNWESLAGGGNERGELVRRAGAEIADDVMSLGAGYEWKLPCLDDKMYVIQEDFEMTYCVGLEHDRLAWL